MFPNTHTEFPWRMAVTETTGTKAVFDTAEGWQAYAEGGGHLKVATSMAEFPSLHGEPVVFARPSRAQEALAKALRMQGVRTLAETDDNYFANPNLNIFSREDKEYDLKQRIHSVAMASMHGVVFSTQWLRDRYLREFRDRFHVKGLAKKDWLPEMFVCRNHMPSWEWPDPEPYDGPTRFGFMGSPSHVFDLAQLGYASFHAAKHLGCHTICIGYSPSDPDPDIPEEIEIDGEMVPTRTERSLAVSRKWQSVVDEHVHWQDPAVFKRGGLPLDIALAPLLSNDFNFGRSDIKAVEAVVAGAAPVVSRHPVFSRAGWEHGVNCLMGGDQEDLAHQVVRLVKDRPMREALVESGREMVRTERNEHTMAAEWNEALGL